MKTDPPQGAFEAPAEARPGSLQPVPRLRGLPLQRSERSSWTETELEWVQRCLEASLPAGLIARILGRSLDEVEAHIISLSGGAGWTRAERLELRRLYGTHTDEELARRFGRPVEDVRRVALELRLAKDKAYLRRLNGRGATRMPRWGARELDYLAENYAAQPNIEIARVLRRSLTSVVSKAHQLGLKKSPARLKEMGRQNVSLRYEELRPHPR